MLRIATKYPQNLLRPKIDDSSLIASVRTPIKKQRFLSLIKNDLFAKKSEILTILSFKYIEI
jgi:hypothetical protein